MGSFTLCTASYSCPHLNKGQCNTEGKMVSGGEQSLCRAHIRWAFLAAAVEHAASCAFTAMLCCCAMG